MSWEEELVKRLDSHPDYAEISVGALKESIATLRKKFGSKPLLEPVAFLAGDKCEECGGADSRVINSKSHPTKPYCRRRECVVCGNRWNTMEVMNTFKRTYNDNSGRMK